MSFSFEHLWKSDVAQMRVDAVAPNDRPREVVEDGQSPHLRGPHGYGWDGVALAGRTIVRGPAVTSVCLDIFASRHLCEARLDAGRILWRLARTVTVAGDVDDVTVMHEPSDERRGTPPSAPPRVRPIVSPNVLQWTQRPRSAAAIARSVRLKWL